MFDEQFPEDDEHAECRHEIHRLESELERVKAERDEISVVIDKLNRHFFELQDDSDIVHDSVKRLREILGVKNEL